MRELDKTVKQELLAPFQAAEVRIKPGKTPMPYVTARTVQSRLDDVLPWQWSFRLGDRWTDAKGVLHQVGVLEILAGDRMLMFHDVGSAPPDMGNGPAKQAKQAVSDVFKRCAVQIGIGRVLYEMAGVRAEGIPEASLKRAVAAVGWTGTIERHHWGKIGGVRELDAEDEDVPDGEDDGQGDPAPAPHAEKAARPVEPTPAASANGTATVTPLSTLSLAGEKAKCAALSKQAFGEDGKALVAFLRGEGIERTTTAAEFHAASEALTRYLASHHVDLVLTPVPPDAPSSETAIDAIKGGRR